MSNQTQRIGRSETGGLNDFPCMAMHLQRVWAGAKEPCSEFQGRQGRGTK